MGESLKAILQLFVIVAAIFTFIVWYDSRPDLTIWVLRFAIPLPAVVIAWLLVRDSSRKEILPDRLRAETGSYYEREGFCFSFVPVAIAGISWMQVYFQNRHAKACIARVVMVPPREYFLGKQLPLAGIDVEIDCDGAAFGVCRIPWPIPARLQGKKVKFEVACSVKYPTGRGKLMRFRQGLRVGTPGGEIARALTTGGLLLLGVITISRPARIKILLPSNVREVSPIGANVWCEILDRPDFATGGFPVIQKDG